MRNFVFVRHFGFDLAPHLIVVSKCVRERDRERAGNSVCVQRCL